MGSISFETRVVADRSLDWSGSELKGPCMNSPIAYAEPQFQFRQTCSFDRPKEFQGDTVIEKARQLLGSRGLVELNRIRCEYEDGRLTLRGRLSSYHLKQLAQESLRTLMEVRQIVNATEVFSQRMGQSMEFD
jgi:hypothetical protein